MSHASGVVVYGPTNHRGQIDRGPIGSLYAVHFAVPVLCTAAALRGDTPATDGDRMILSLDTEELAHDIALMVLTDANAGTSPVPLYPFEPRGGDGTESGFVFREGLFEAVRDAVALAPALCLHLMRFDHDLLGDPVALRLRELGFAVETFDSNEEHVR